MSKAKKDPVALFVLTVTSESGDDYSPYIFRTKPDDERLMQFLRDNCYVPDDDELGDENCGWKGTYLEVEWAEFKESEINSLCQSSVTTRPGEHTRTQSKRLAKANG